MNKAKPILFSTPMVQAILDGRKIMTRRVMTPQPLFYTGRYVFADDVCPKKWVDCDNIIDTYKYQPDDVLWVRETWGDYGEGCTYYLYRADYPGGATGYWYEPEHINWCDLPKWRPSIFMPREAARIFLRVTDVRAERLQNITEADAECEGVIARHDTACTGTSARISFAELWESINAKRGYGWDKNPWVWVISFERVEKPSEGESK